jgi:hypothetical protein
LAFGVSAGSPFSYLLYPTYRILVCGTGAFDLAEDFGTNVRMSLLSPGGSMRFVLLSFLVSVPALACPAIDGHYVCTYDGQFGHKVIELNGQTKSNSRGQTVYVVNGKEIYPDGVEHHADSLPILDQWADDVNYIATCSGENVVHIRGNARVKKFGSRADLDGDLTARSARELDASFRVNMGFFATDVAVPCTRH